LPDLLGFSANIQFSAMPGVFYFFMPVRRRAAPRSRELPVTAARPYRDNRRFTAISR
jgi:hypothetical protein